MARRKAFTKARRRLFLAKLIETGNVSEAAREIDMNRQYMYDLRDGKGDTKAIPGFKAEWEAAEAEYLDECEKELHRRAYKGVKRLKEKRKIAINEDGTEKVLEVTREATTFHSDTLLQFHMTSRHPDYKKASKLEISTPEGKPLQIEDTSGWDLTGLSYDQLCELRELQQLAKPAPPPAQPDAAG